MQIDITPSEKLQIIEQHIKNVIYSQYNVELSIIEANAVSTPNQETLNNLNNQMQNINAQLALLQKEHDTISAQVISDAPPSN